MLLAIRSQQTVAQQNAQKSACQSRWHLVNDLLRWPSERTHGDDDPQDGRNDPETRQGVRGGAESGHRLGGGLMVLFHAQVHHLIDVVWVKDARSGGPHGMADDMADEFLDSGGRS
jgi:hypothetical protein